MTRLLSLSVGRWATFTDQFFPEIQEYSSFDHSVLLCPRFTTLPCISYLQAAIHALVATQPGIFSSPHGELQSSAKVNLILLFPSHVMYYHVLLSGIIPCFHVVFEILLYSLTHYLFHIVHCIPHGACHSEVIVFYVTGVSFYACMISLHFSCFRHPGSTLFTM